MEQFTKEELHEIEKVFDFAWGTAVANWIHGCRELAQAGVPSSDPLAKQITKDAAATIGAYKDITEKAHKLLME